MPRQPHQPGAPDFAILGLLILGPRHGYELLPHFSRGGELGLVCTLGTPRLYAILHALEEIGLVRCETEPPSSGPPRKVFSVTEAGIEAFRAWLRQPIRRLRQIRQDFLLKLYFSRVIPGHDTREVIAGQIAASRAVSEEPPAGCRRRAGRQLRAAGLPITPGHRRCHGPLARSGARTRLRARPPTT